MDVSVIFECFLLIFFLSIFFFFSFITVVSNPPYELSECGYAGFLLPIEIYFKNKSQSNRKIRFDYDLFLNGPGSPAINNVRLEKLKFRNPADDFKQKLINAGAVSSFILSVV